MNLRYIIPRLARHFLPERMIRFLLRRGWIIRPGLETREPELAVEHYHQVLALKGISINGKRVLVFGYGGHFAVGVELLRRGASHVVLCDRFAPPDHNRNRNLLPGAEKYLQEYQKQVLARPEFITLIQEDICFAAKGHLFLPVDLVLSTSVFEHLPDDEMDSLLAALAEMTLPEGVHLHFIDMRDHFFKYPFEMLTYTKRAWRSWLNPTSNLNRLRMGDYRAVFEKNFHSAEISIIEKDESAFARVRTQIRPEFVTGDINIDSVTQIQVFARQRV